MTDSDILLDLLLAEAGYNSPPTIKSVAKTAPLPLSFAQERLWFLNQLEPHNVAYHIPLTFHLQRWPDLNLLQLALHDVTQRHESLRTIFINENGTPKQLILPHLDLQLTVIDFTDSTTSLLTEIQRPFDLTTAPLWRVVLFRLNDHEAIFLWVIHHIIADGWSMNIFIDELNSYYAARLYQTAPKLPDLTVQYADFVMWQREWLQAERLQPQLDYWKKQLAHSTNQRLQLPTDYPPPAIQSYHGASYHFEIPALLVESLQQLSQSAQATLFMTLLTAFKVLLYRYSNQDDILVGTPMAYRTHPEVTGLIGFFVNTLVIRTNLADNPSFLTLLQQVRQTTLAAYSHQDVPFEKLVAELQPSRTLSHSPLFQVMFVLEEILPSNLTLGEVTSQPLKVEHGTSKFDLTLFLERTQTTPGLSGTLEYNSDMFKAETIERMAGHLQTLLANIITNPHQPIATLPMLTAAELQQFQTWNDTTIHYPSDLTIVDLFEQQVARTPDNIAVIFEQSQLTYQALNRRANQLAHYLQSLGVGPEVLVGICVERSLDMVVGLLGILKAGGAYLPLDPDYPAERLQFMLQDSHVSILLSQSHLQEQLPTTQAIVLHLDSDWEQINGYSPENPQIPQNHGHLAYVIYTSGSTGQPKGTAILHRGLTNYLCWATQAYQVAQGQGAPVHSSINFDLTITALFLPLMVGGSIILLPKSPGGEALTQILLTQNNFSLVKLTPAHVEFLSQQLPPTLAPDRTHYLVIGGEALRAEQLTFWLKHAPQTKLINEYGPTETVVGCCVYEIPVNTPLPATIPIGRPIANTQLYVLDRYLQPVPLGVWGELYIGGHGVARGYLQQPDLTAEHFFELTLPSFGHVGRVYKSGDMVRYLADGNLEFGGRRDHQVKIRGYRIELGEIEALLGRHEMVQQTVVTTSTKGYLVAYVVPKATDKTVDLPTMLRAFLQIKLPDYMIPSAFVMLEQFPLTPNGKIDRQALPNPDNQANLNNHGQNFAPPQTPTEQLVAAIWAEVLGLTQVSRHANFFDLGGHSLLAIQIISKLNFQLQLNLSVKAIFMAPTVETMAELISQTKILPSAKQSLPKPETSFTPLPRSLTTEARPLLSLLISHRLPPVEAVALSYFEQANPARGELIAAWGAGLSLFTEINETALGRVAIITLPYFDNELYNKGEKLQQDMVESLRLAKSVGAKVVSLTGLIPSASHYGQSLITALNPTETFPIVSTGHATTTAAVILAIEHILQISQRHIAQERVAFLGLGSIGTASLELFLKTQPHPKELILCDLYSKKSVLEELKEQVLTKFNFQGAIKIIQSSGQVPPEFYEATLIVGATNVPEILEVNDLHPGTIIIDDSAPHCFNVAAAIQRVESQKDILFTEGGMLKSPKPIHSTLYLPVANDIVLQDYLSTYDPTYITGCVFSALLSAQLQAKTTIGLVDVTASFQHYELLKKLKFQAADIHCLHYKLPESVIAHFREHFGN